VRCTLFLQFLLEKVSPTFAGASPNNNELFSRRSVEGLWDCLTTGISLRRRSSAIEVVDNCSDPSWIVCVCVCMCVCVEVLPSRIGRTHDLLVQTEWKLRHQPAHAQRVSLLSLPEVFRFGNVSWRYARSACLCLSVCLSVCPNLESCRGCTGT